jgi:hypothetical protein
MESIYWVISRDCNQRCPHCYNDSEPGAPGLDRDQITQCIDNFPRPKEAPVGRVILSGGEVLVWPDLLFQALQDLRNLYGELTQLWVQTNGDLLDEAMLDRLLAAHVSRIDVASMDKYHVKGTLQRRPLLQQMFLSRGMVAVDLEQDESVPQQGSKVFAFWGATEDEWIGPLWPRGRAHQKGLSKAGPDDEFCRMWSGAKHFLDYRSPKSEISIQLADVYPCCPMTCRPIGNLIDEPLLSMLDRCREHPVYQALNEGRPEAMGESMGISEKFGQQRSRELGNHCLWCAEFFSSCAPNLLVAGARTERGEVDLVQLGDGRNSIAHRP